MTSIVHLGFFAGLYCLSLFFGSGLWLLLSSEKQRSDVASLLCLGPVLGIAWIGLFLANAFSLRLSFDTASIGLSLATIGLNGWAYWRCRTSIRCVLRWRRLAAARATLLVGLAILFSIALLVPVIDKPYLTLPWRIGPDAAGYTGAAQFILDGRTAADLNANNIVPVGMVAREFLWVALRRGLPLALAFYSRVFHQHPVQVVFYLVALCYLLLAVCAAKLFAEASTKKDLPFAILAGMFVGFNCNILFVFLEGGYGQIACMALSMGMLLCIFSSVRVNQTNRMESTRLLLLVGFLVSSALTFYAESIFLIVSVTIGYLALSFLRVRFRLPRIFLLTPLVAFLFSPAVVWSWVNLQIINFGNLTNGRIGWPQPQWAYIVELLGLRDMYRLPIDPGARIMIPVEPQGIALFLSVSLSLLAFSGAMTLFFHRKTRAVQWFFLALGLIVAAHLYLRLDMGIHNYAYTKFAVFISPLLLLGAFGMVSSYVDRPAWRWLLGGSLVAVAVSNGIRSLHTYHAEEYYLTKGDLELAIVPRLQGDRLVLLRDESNLGSADRWMLMPLLSGKLTRATDLLPAQGAFDWMTNSSPLLFLEKKVDAGQLGGASEIARKKGILWEGSDYRLMDLGLVVKDALYYAGTRDAANYLRGHGEADSAFRFTGGWSRTPNEPHLLMISPIAYLGVDITKQQQLFLSYEAKSLGPSGTVLFFMNGRQLHRAELSAGAYCRHRIDISSFVNVGINMLRVESDAFVVPHDLYKNNDMRRAYAVFGSLGIHATAATDEASSRFVPGAL